MKIYSVLAAIVLSLALLSQWVRLPLSFQGVWMSPDETANSLSAMYFADHGSFLIPNLSLKDLPWVFPRSFVPIIENGAVALVGFLGMPLILSLAYKAIGIYGILFFTPLFALISLWPLWKSLPKEWSKGIKWSVLLVWISFPMVIIYANRGTFSNLFITCLAIWLWWLVVELKSGWKWPVAGAVLGLACVIRPTEAAWLVPLAGFAALYQIQITKNKIKASKIIWLAVMFVLVTGVGAYLGYKTYGQWFISGYQVRPDFAMATQTSIDQVSGQNSISVLKALPFGVHPRAILWNAYHYLVEILWPWLLMVALAGYFCLKEEIWKKPEKWIVAVFAWTAIWLTAFYGNGVYQDHVGVNVASMGNSYLRYLLPLSLLAAASAGFVVARLWKYWSLRILSLAMIVALIVVGQWSALARDDEGMLANQEELARYAEIRDQARSVINSNAIILSDRSDKIFFPVFNAASPMPDDKSIQAILDAGYSVALFMQTQSSIKSAQWWDRGFDLKPVFSDANQTMYTVTGNGNQQEFPMVDQSPTL